MVASVEPRFKVTQSKRKSSGNFLVIDFWISLPPPINFVHASHIYHKD